MLKLDALKNLKFEKLSMKEFESYSVIDSEKIYGGKLYDGDTAVICSGEQGDITIYDSIYSPDTYEEMAAHGLIGG